MGFLGSDDTLLGLVGAVNNLDEPTPALNMRETILGLCISIAIIAWLCVGLRLYTRFRVIYAPGWDDLFVVLSLLFISLGLLSICLATNTGMGQHFLRLTLDQISGYFRIFYVANAAYCVSTALIKISLILQYLRIYRRGTLLFNACRMLLVLVACWGLTYSIMAWVPCVPVSTYWTQIYSPSTPTRCYGYGSTSVAVFRATYESHAIANVILDLLVLALPVPLYFQTDTPLRTIQGLLALLFMGMVVNVFSLWRFVSMLYHRSTTYPTFDPMWYGPVSIVMAGMEIAAACICASVPVFWGPMVASASQLFGHIFVTKEVKVTTQHRFELFGSKDDISTLAPRLGTDLECYKREAKLVGKKYEARVGCTEEGAVSFQYNHEGIWAG